MVKTNKIYKTLSKPEDGMISESPLNVDASFRRYFRLPNNYLLMDSPPQLYHLQDFIDITKQLKNLKVQVPKLFYADTTNGFLLLEDLGDDTLSRIFTRKTHDKNQEAQLYHLTLSSLMAMQENYQHTNVKKLLPLKLYDKQKLWQEISLLLYWYLPDYFKSQNRSKILSDSIIENFEKIFTELYHLINTTAAPIFSCLVHRDFHVDNLLLLKATNNVAWLDYQDAVLGHPVYDVMSLLEDARRDLTSSLKQELWQSYQNWYLAKAKKIKSKFDITATIQKLLLSYQFLAMVRHAKVLGIFVRLDQRDDKPQYRQHLKRVRGLFQMAVRQLNQLANELPLSEKAIWQQPLALLNGFLIEYDLC